MRLIKPNITLAPSEPEARQLRAFSTRSFGGGWGGGAGARTGSASSSSARVTALGQPGAAVARRTQHPHALCPLGTASCIGRTQRRLEAGLAAHEGHRVGSHRRATLGAAQRLHTGPQGFRIWAGLRARAAADRELQRGRIHAPTAGSNRFWFQLDGGPWHKWRISVGEIWFWDAFHEDANYGTPLPFPLGTGAHQLVLASCVEGVWLDRLYMTADGDTPPGNSTLCSPPHSIDVGGVCMASCGSHGKTACGKTACAGQMQWTSYDCDVCCIVP